MTSAIPTVPPVGEIAPDFTLLTDAGEPLTLSAQRGRAVVLFFYPKDDTTGCTTEACEFRDIFPRFDGSRALVLGISPDSVTSHVKFRAKYQLPFSLLADVEHSVAEATASGARSRCTAGSTWASSGPRSWSMRRGASPTSSRR
jgi:peroxiredoxin